MFERLDLDDAIRDIEKMKKEISRLKYQVKKEKKERLAVFEKHVAVDVRKLRELWELCQEFIDEHRVSCGESACQSEGVSAEAPVLVARIGEIVGFFNDEEDSGG